MVWSQLRVRRACALLPAWLMATAPLAAAGPCDIYASGGTPCVAAHSTTRALYSAYSGSLYQVKRGSDDSTTDIKPRSAGGVADGNAQDTFCTGTTCLISIIYDQSGRGNHLTQAPPGGFPGPNVNGYDDLAAAEGAPVTLNGQKAYGAFFSPGTGYRNNAAKGTATGDEPEGMYAVFDGTHYNGGCCFDYGNGEVNTLDNGNGHMEAVYFGSNTGYGFGTGDGPWVLADLENKLAAASEDGRNPDVPALSSRFVTAILKGEPNHWAIRGGDANSGGLSTYYDGVRPNMPGYSPMSKEGAIILGIGGDNSVNAQGTFYEGVMTSGYPTDDTEGSVQADIVKAGYAPASLTSGDPLETGRSVSLRVTTAGFDTRYLAHSDATVNTQVVSGSSPAALKRQATWTVRAGRGNAACVSFESADSPGSFMRHRNYALEVGAPDGSKLFDEDTTFCPIAGVAGADAGTSFRSWSWPARYLRHFDSLLYIGANGGVHAFDNKASFNADVTWAVVDGFA